MVNVKVKKTCIEENRGVVGHENIDKNLKTLFHNWKIGYFHLGVIFKRFTNRLALPLTH